MTLSRTALRSRASPPASCHNRLNRLMEVEAEAVRCGNEKDLKLLPVSLIDSPIPDADAIRLEVLFRAVNVRNQDCRAILRSITTVYRETDLYAVPLKYHG